MTAEVLTETQEPTQASQPREIRREDFGPGNAGEWSYQTVISGAKCTTWVDGNETECGKPSIGTVDIDVRDDLELYPFCSTEHQGLVQSQVIDQLREQGRYSVPGMNGFNRNISKSRATSEAQ